MMETAYLARRIFIKRELIKNLQTEIAALQTAIQSHLDTLNELEKTSAQQNSQQAVGKTQRVQREAQK